MRTLVTRGDTSQIKTFDRMVMELSPYMTPIEIDRTVGFMDRIQGSQWDINPSDEDSITQLQLILGTDRYVELKYLWSKDNQQLLKEYGQKKFIRKSDGTLWDGLDPEDKQEDYQEIFI